VEEGWKILGGRSVHSRSTAPPAELYHGFSTAGERNPINLTKMLLDRADHPVEILITDP
jgi:hypothetical protein